MNITDTEFTSWVAMYMLPFFRVAALVSVAPIFGTHTVPARIKLILAFALTIMIAPILPKTENIAPFSINGIIAIVHQVLIGLAIGFMVTMVFGALVTAGQLIAQLMGLGFASMMDPQNGVSVPVVGQFYTIIATLIFLITNGHLVMLDVLVSSFQTIPVGEYGLSVDRILELVLWGKWIFAAAVVIALPSITALLLVNIAFGVMTRAAPQLNIFAVGFPITILIGFVIIFISLPHFVPKLQQLLDFAFNFSRNTLLVRGG